MYSLLLAVIYLAFISLGLPDSLMGAGWPVMHQALAVSPSYLGIINIIIAAGTVVSSLCSDVLTKKFGAGLVTAMSCAMTAFALVGFALAPSVWVICLLALPYGLGAGAVDASINNFVALHYKARHMSWLHCFWGVGASISPYIMSLALVSRGGWRDGFWWVSYIQIGLTLALLISLPLWRKVGTRPEHETETSVAMKPWEVVHRPGVPLIMATFFVFCALESTTGMWASTYLVNHYGFDPQVAARFGAYFYIGITIGRFFCGFVTEKLGDKMLIRIGAIVTLVGALGLTVESISLPCLILTGFGTSPIYPAIIHATPERFGVRYSQAIIGVEMASAYVGIIVSPALFGLLADWVSIGLYPYYVVGLAALLLFLSERFNGKMKAIQL